MANLLNSLSAFASGLSALGSGGAVSLGGVPFQSFDTPERMPFGGAQSLTVHKLPGGARVIDLMGPDDADIEFSGVLTGPQAMSKARQLDAMRAAGTPVSLTWPGFQRQVIVREFHCDYERGGFWCPYRISCVVISAQPVSVASGLSALTSLVGSDIANGITSVTSAIGAVGDAIGGAVQYAQNALGQVTPIISATASIAGINVGGPLSKVYGALSTASGFASVAGGLARAPQAVASTVTNLQTAASGVADGISRSGTILANIASGAPSGSLFSGAAAIQNAGAAAGTLAGAADARGFVGRALTALTPAPS